MNALRLAQYKIDNLKTENIKLKGLNAFFGITIGLAVFSIFWLGLFTFAQSLS